jgi:ketosteroid isomerase-like protein
MNPTPARRPEELGPLLVARLNAGDVDGVVALYEPDAVMARPGGAEAAGAGAIRAAFAELVAAAPFTPGTPLRTLVSGDLALTATRLAGGAIAVEVSRRQPDGTWRWVLDQPDVAAG